MKKFYVFLFIAASFSLTVHSQAYHYDVNGDGHVSSVDVTALYDYLLGNVQQHEYVDMGLPSGTLWATMNIGASSPEDYGDYFAWGETSPKDVYGWSTYKWCNGSTNTLTKYCTNGNNGYNSYRDNKNELDPDDDAATANWGPEWRMPSIEQMQELNNNCSTVWTTRNGVDGMLFTSNINGKSLFLPAAGYRSGSSFNYQGTDSYYWSRTLYTGNPNDACNMSVLSGTVYWLQTYRTQGQSVRAVRVSKN